MKTTRTAELNRNRISKVSGARRNNAGSKPSSRIKPVCLSAIRRSPRVAAAAAMESKNEKGQIQPLGRRRSYKRRNSGNQIPANEEARMYAARRAEEIQSVLGADSPSFVKSMGYSHVAGSFWLNLPASFCKDYLPKHDDYITLLDEDGNKSTTKYLYFAQRRGLSAGWRRFSLDHELSDGDAIVFQLIQPTMLKVYVVRVNDPAIIGSLKAENTDVKEAAFYKNEEVGEAPTNGKCYSHVPPDDLQGNVKESNQVQRSDPSVEERRNPCMEDFPSNFENFKIIVNGESVDHEFTKQARADYYNLCRSRKSFLHKNLRKSISGTLAVGIITRILNMANAIRESKLSGSNDDFEVWEKTLVAFEQMGLDVGFIRDRLNRLMSLVSESRVNEELKRYEEVRNKRDCTEEEIMNLQANLMNLKHNKARLEDEMVDIRVNLHRYECVFEDDASAPW